MSKKKDQKRKSSSKERVSPEEYLALQQELEETKRKYGVVDEPKPEGRISRAISKAFEWRDARPKHSISKKTYLKLMLLGIVGAHRFYAKQYVTGVLYLLACWTGFSIAMTIIDLLVVIPMKPDENGHILM